MKIEEEYPKEYYIELVDNSYLLGRIILNKTHKNFMIELDLVTNESRKIYKHVDTIFSDAPEREIVDEAVHALRNYFKECQEND